MSDYELIGRALRSIRADAEAILDRKVPEQWHREVWTDLARINAELARRIPEWIRYELPGSFGGGHYFAPRQVGR